LDPLFVSDLTESSFSLTKHRETKAKFGMSMGLIFKITMLINEKELIEKVKAYFNYIFINKNGSIYFIVADFSNLLKIRDHFIHFLFNYILTNIVVTLNIVISSSLSLSISVIRLAIISFIFIPEEILSLANILALILFL